MLLTAILAAALAADPKDKPTTLYFPSVVGTKLVYEQRIGDHTSEVSETVTKVEGADGLMTVTVDRKSGGRPRPRVLYGSAKGVFARVDKGTPADPVFDPAVKAGEKWTVERPAVGVPGTVTVTYTVGKEEELDLPAGKFKAVPVTSVASLPGVSTSTAVTWYSAGVGVVRLEYDGGGSTYTNVLKSFTPGKGEVEKK